MFVVSNEIILDWIFHRNVYHSEVLQAACDQQLPANHRIPWQKNVIVPETMPPREYPLLLGHNSFQMVIKTLNMLKLSSIHRHNTQGIHRHIHNAFEQARIQCLFYSNLLGITEHGRRR